MTEMQPTEIELTGKKKKTPSVSKRKIVIFALAILILALAAGLTAILANRSSKPPTNTMQVAPATQKQTE